jgi:type II secretory pathway component HofQ
MTMKKNNLLNVFMLFITTLILCSYDSGRCEPASDISRINISELDFEKADIRQIMKTLSEIGNRNIILDKEVTGECTIFLKNISWPEALVAVMKMNDLVAYEDRGFIKVMKRIDFDNQQKLLLEKQKVRKREEPVKVQVIKIHHSNAADMKNTLDPLLGKPDQPSVDRRTNSLVFTVSDSSFSVIKSIVTELDTETKQISIEVKMVTVDSNYSSELGINWNATNKNNSASQQSITTKDKLLNVTVSGTISNTVLNATLASLIDKNKAEVVSRPHITTQDNEPANISSGSQVPYVTYDQARNTIVQLFDASTALLVTPHVLTDERILLDVEAIRRTAQGVGVGLSISEEKAKVKMITSDGETAVIGGMRQLQETKQDQGIPILQEIPLLGTLFKYTKRETKKTDLIIFITPRIELPMGTQAKSAEQ